MGGAGAGSGGGGKPPAKYWGFLAPRKNNPSGPKPGGKKSHHRLGIPTGRRRCWLGSWSTSTSNIWRFLRAQKIDLSGRKSWCQSTDPDLVPKAADIVGPYMAPPTNAVVLSVDEKPSIQAL